MMNKHPIGLFGGTFDPIHNGHTKVANELINGLKLQAMHFIPNKEPLYRHKPMANAEDRLAMVRIATAKNPKFIVNDIEIKRPGPTYSIDTIISIRKQIPDQPLCLILGKDVFSKMNTWHNWSTIPELTHLVIINRPSAPTSHEPWIETLLKEREVCNVQKLHSKPGGYILQYEIEPVTISATKIRKKLKEKKVLSNELAPEVFRYIEQHHLYT